jgi:hypothetical protein
VKSVKYHVSFVSALLLAAVCVAQPLLAQQLGVQPAQNEKGEQVWSVNFNDTDIQEVIKIIFSFIGCLRIYCCGKRQYCQNSGQPGCP